MDQSGVRDVTAALQRAIDGTPDGAILMLRAGAHYRVDDTLRIRGRHDLEIDGRGAFLVRTDAAATKHRIVAIANATGIVVRDVSIVGNNPEPGVLDGVHEQEHAIWIAGGSGIEISGVTIRNPRGDCVYVGNGDGEFSWSDGVSIQDLDCTGTGRNGVSITAGRNVLIEGSSFGQIGYHAFDVEPNHTTPLEGATQVTFRSNVIHAPVADYVFAADGWGPVDHVTITGNRVYGKELRTTVRPVDGSGYRRVAISITNNWSDTPARGPVHVLRSERWPHRDREHATDEPGQSRFSQELDGRGHFRKWGMTAERPGVRSCQAFLLLVPIPDRVPAAPPGRASSGFRRPEPSWSSRRRGACPPRAAVNSRRRSIRRSCRRT